MRRAIIIFCFCFVFQSSTMAISNLNKYEYIILNSVKYVIKEDKYFSGEKQNLSEEGASVDTSDTQKNYKVEAPTIILLTFFGILTIIALVLIIFKI